MWNDSTNHSLDILAQKACVYKGSVPQVDHMLILKFHVMNTQRMQDGCDINQESEHSVLYCSDDETFQLSLDEEKLH